MTNVADTVGLVSQCEESQDGGLWNCEGRLGLLGRAVQSKLDGFCPGVFLSQVLACTIAVAKTQIGTPGFPNICIPGRIERIVILVSFQKV